MSYDENARRDTPLAGKLKERIRRDGPISVAYYMDACLHDPEHGYYRRRPAIGAAADFITAPEISQIFGELIGLWCAVVWDGMGRPSSISLVELGPGRGTMMRDALRALRAAPDFLRSVQVVLCESSGALRAIQKETLADALVPVRWRDRWDAGDEGVLGRQAIVLGNEYLDAMPVDQYIRVAGGWAPRQVGLDAMDRLVFVQGEPISGDGAARSSLDTAHPNASLGDIAEEGSRFEIPPLLAFTTMACLFIDYGHTTSAAGNTLQAVRDHAYEHPLTSPGEADLTTQVDFDAFGRTLRQHDRLRIDGPVTQAEFLGRLGIMERASRLMAANPPHAAEIEMAVARLMAPTGMGTRFKAIGIRGPNLSPLPGFV
jgi:SAM-dependent MidA family methyltransferase